MRSSLPLPSHRVTKREPSTAIRILLTGRFFASTRTLTALAHQRYAPSFFKRTSKHGVPYIAVIVPTGFSFLSFLSVSHGSNQAFSWLSNIASTYPTSLQTLN